MNRKFVLTLSAAVLLGGFGASSAMASSDLGVYVQNGSFNTTVNSPKGYFTNVQPANWGLNPGGGNLVFVDNASNPGEDAASSVYLQTYADPAGAGVTGNYVEADGNPSYEDSITQTLTGLTPGQTYTLGFYQAASQQTTFHGDTVNRWIVSLGTTALQIEGGGPFSPIYGPTDQYVSSDPNASIAASTLMSVPSGTATNWQFVTVTLKADASTQVLSFLAWGDEGSTVNLPPMAFLTGVGATMGTGVSVPEPAVWTMMLIGVMGVGGMARARRRSIVAAA